MNTLGPPKAKRRLWQTALRKLQLLGPCHVAAFLARVFGLPFWWSEQWRANFADRIDNEKSDE
jgi:hypothetical protein